MAVNFMDGNLYFVDFDGLTKMMNKMPIVDKQDLKESYLSDWMSKLKSVEKETEHLFMRPSIDMVTNELRHPERFQFPMVYSNTTIYVHFSISAINDELQGTGGLANDIPMEAFTSEYGQIEWTKPTDIVPSKEGPILLAPLAIGEFTQWIVIDGNHRVDNAIRSNMSSIQGLCLNHQELVDKNMFCSEFDKLAYVFQNEIVALATKKKLTNMTDEDILSLSYLKSGIVNLALPED